MVWSLDLLPVTAHNQPCLPSPMPLCAQIYPQIIPSRLRDLQGNERCRLLCTTGCRNQPFAAPRGPVTRCRAPTTTAMYRCTSLGSCGQCVLLMLCAMQEAQCAADAVCDAGGPAAESLAVPLISHPARAARLAFQPRSVQPPMTRQHSSALISTHQHSSLSVQTVALSTRMVVQNR